MVYQLSDQVLDRLNEAYRKVEFGPLVIDENVLTEAELKQLIEYMLEQGHGKRIKHSSLSPRIQASYEKLEQAGLVRSFRDTEGEKFYISVSLPSPFNFEIGAEQINEMMDSAKAHVLVRAALTQLILAKKLIIDNNLQQQIIDDSANVLKGGSQRFTELVEQNPHLLQCNIGLFERFDVVIGVDGSHYLVDYAPKSGGLTWRRAQAVAHAELTNEDPANYFNYQVIVSALLKAKELAGLNPADKILIVGGPGHAEQLDVEFMRNAGVNVSRYPMMSEGYTKADWDDQIYFDEVEFKQVEDGLEVYYQGEVIDRVQGVYFMYGHEHVDNGTERMNKFLAMQHAGVEGKIKFLNHPYMMDIVENKLVVTLVQSDPQIRQMVVNLMQDEWGLTQQDINHALSKFLDSQPFSIPVQIDKRKGSIFMGRIESQSLGDRALAKKPNTEKLSSENRDQLRREVISLIGSDAEDLGLSEDGGALMLKPAGSFGARGIEVIRGESLEEVVNGVIEFILDHNSPNVFVIQAVVEPIRIPVPDVINYLAEGEMPKLPFAVPRAEFFFNHVMGGELSFEFIGMSATCLPKEDDTGIVSHGGSTGVPILARRETKD